MCTCTKTQNDDNKDHAYTHRRVKSFVVGYEVIVIWKSGVILMMNIPSWMLRRYVNV